MMESESKYIYQIHYYNKTVKLFSRNLLDITENFNNISSKLLDYFANSKVNDTILDSEIILIDENNNPLPFQNLMKKNKSNLYKIILFDVLQLNNINLSKNTLLNRKNLLTETFHDSSSIEIIKYHLMKINSVQDIETLYKKAIQDKCEGLMIKDSTSSYNFTEKRKDWMKV